METQERTVFEAILREREYQDKKYGRVGVDRQPTIGDWILILEEEVSEARLAQVKGRASEALCEILQVATVAVAALMQHGVMERGSE